MTTASNVDPQDPGSSTGPQSEAAPSAQPRGDSGSRTPAPPPAAAPATAPEPAGPRTGPIVWGALILGFCGYVVQRTLSPGDLDATTWITAVTIGLGVLLLGVGTVVLIRNHRRSRRTATSDPHRA